MSKTTGYTGTAKTLHWLILALLIVQFAVAWTMPDIKRDTKPDTLINLHLSIGVLILSVAVVRLAWRATHGEPAPHDGVPPWQVQSARIMHWLLYLLLFVLPVLGWINASWRGFPVIMFGSNCRSWSARGCPAGAGPATCTVSSPNYGLLVLVGLHVAAALYHYFVRRDGVLQRMRPGA